MKRIIYLLLAFLASIFYISCHRQSKYENLSVEQFQSLLEGSGIQLVDVRTGLEYSGEHISGALNINVLDDSFDVLADSLLQKDIPVAVYCRTGRRSRTAADKLSKKGYKVYNLDKGFNAWKDAHKAVEK